MQWLKLHRVDQRYQVHLEWGQKCKHRVRGTARNTGPLENKYNWAPYIFLYVLKKMHLTHSSVKIS